MIVLSHSAWRLFVLGLGLSVGSHDTLRVVCGVVVFGMANEATIPTLLGRCTIHHTCNLLDRPAPRGVHRNKQALTLNPGVNIEG